MRDTWSALLRLAPPPQDPVDPGTPERWRIVEKLLGTPLPADYKWLVSTYGSGEFCDLFGVWNPFAQEGMNLLSQREEVLNRYRESGAVFSERCLFPTFPELGGLLPVGHTTNDDDMFWVTRGQPEEWTLVLYDWRGGCDFEEHAMPLIDFLASWLSGSMPQSFFGSGNAPVIIRRDPVFCPSGKTRPPRV
jgi:SUKH superfamily protein